MKRLLSLCLAAACLAPPSVRAKPRGPGRLSNEYSRKADSYFRVRDWRHAAYYYQQAFRARPSLRACERLVAIYHNAGSDPAALDWLHRELPWRKKDRGYYLELAHAYGAIPGAAYRTEETRLLRALVDQYPKWSAPRDLLEQITVRKPSRL